MHSQEGAELFVRDRNVVVLEDAVADEDNGGEAAGSDDISMQPELFPQGSANREALTELVRTAVREELIAISEEGYLAQAAEEGRALAAAEAEARKGMVNINTDDVKELMKLDGIGEKRAQDIMRYRAENGDFKAPQDIMKVSGIKASLYEKIKDKIYTL